MDTQTTPQRIRWWLLVLLGVAAIGLMLVDATGNLDSALGVIQDPIGAVLGWTTAQVSPVSEVIEGPRNIQEARAQISELQVLLEQSELENEQLREMQGEYQLYGALFERTRNTPQFTRLAASVISYNSSPYFQSIIINAGAEDGVSVGMPVEGARGLVGQVYRTTPHAAQVLLITDNISNVPVRLGSSRATGILRGGGIGGEMEVDWIDLEATVDSGEVVLTSGLGGRFPEDLVIGRVVRVEKQESQLHQRAIVRSGTDFSALELVLVILDFQPVDTSIFELPPEQQ